MRINSRDFDFIENRLYGPATGTHDAIERLMKIGEEDLAGQLREALAAFTDACRDVRRDLAEKYNRQRLL